MNKTKAATIAVAVTLTLSLVAASAGAVTTAPPGVATGPVSAVSAHGVVATGTVDPKGATTNWWFEYGAESSATFTAKTPVTDAGDSTSGKGVSASIKGLSPATSYDYRLVASNAGGTTYGSTGVFNTSSPPAVATNAASSIQAASAVLNATVNPEGATTSWRFEYGTTASYGSSTPVKTLTAGPNNVLVSATVSGLNPHTTYYFRILASNASGSAHGSGVTLTTDLAVTLDTSTATVVYGGFVTLSGVVTSGQSGLQVTIMSESFSQTTFAGIAEVTTGAAGAWSYSAQPLVRTTYEAYANGGTSSPTIVSVRPAVYLTINKSNVLITHVVASSSFASHVLQLQRLSGGLWVTWKHVRLNTAAHASFTTALPKGSTPVRMAIGPFVPGVDQAGPGYLAGFSRSVVYKTH